MTYMFHDEIGNIFEPQLENVPLNMHPVNTKNRLPPQSLEETLDPCLSKELLTNTDQTGCAG